MTGVKVSSRRPCTNRMRTTDRRVKREAHVSGVWLTGCWNCSIREVGGGARIQNATRRETTADSDSAFCLSKRWGNLLLSGVSAGPPCLPPPSSLPCLSHLIPTGYCGGLALPNQTFLNAGFMCHFHPQIWSSIPNCHLYNDGIPLT